MRSVNGMAPWIGQDEVRGQVAVFAPQSIDDPASQRRSTGDRRDAAVKIANRNLVAVMTGVHRPDDTNIVNNFRCLREQFRDFGATLSMSTELPGAAEQLFARTIHKAEGDLAVVILTVMFGQFGFGVEQIHVGRAPMHEHRDHCGRTRCRPGRSLLEIIRLVLVRFPWRGGEQTFVS